MPGLPLSSNWKRLQQTLQNGDSVKTGEKRKRVEIEKPTRQKKAHTTSSRQGNQRRERSLSGSTSRKMGQYLSSAPSPDLAEPAHQPSGQIHRKSFDRKIGRQDDHINQGLHPTNIPGKYLALDCEMVGSGPPPADTSILARASLVNFHGEQIYDSYVQPQRGERVTDFRTNVSGIRPHHLKADSARSFSEVQASVAELLKGRILVGHASGNDLTALLLSHPKRDIRDTARYPGYRKLAMGKTPALRNLAKDVLGIEIQDGEHSSIEDARATMALFKKEKAGFEQGIKQRYGPAIKREELARRRAGRVVAQSPQANDGEEDEDDVQGVDSLDGEEDQGASDEEVSDDVDGPKKTTQTKKKKKKKHKKRTKRA